MSSGSTQGAARRDVLVMYVVTPSRRLDGTNESAIQ